MACLYHMISGIWGALGVQSPNVYEIDMERDLLEDFNWLHGEGGESEPPEVL